MDIVIDATGTYVSKDGSKVQIVSQMPNGCWLGFCHDRCMSGHWESCGTPLRLYTPRIVEKATKTPNVPREEKNIMPKNETQKGKELFSKNELLIYQLRELARWVEDGKIDAVDFGYDVETREENVYNSEFTPDTICYITPRPTGTVFFNLTYRYKTPKNSIGSET